MTIILSPLPWYSRILLPFPLPCHSYHTHGITVEFSFLR